MKRKIKISPKEFQRIVNEKGYTLRRLAKELHISDGHLSNIKNGHRYVNDELVSPFCQFFGLPEDELFDYINEETPILKSATPRKMDDSPVEPVASIISSFEKTQIDQEQTKCTLQEKYEKVSFSQEQINAELGILKENLNTALNEIKDCKGSIEILNMLIESILKKQVAIKQLLSTCKKYIQVGFILVISLFIFLVCPLFNSAFSEPLFWVIAPLEIVFLLWENERLLHRYGNNPEE